jgi:hypothetical protein
VPIRLTRGKSNTAFVETCALTLPPRGARDGIAASPIRRERVTQAIVRPARETFIESVQAEDVMETGLPAGGQKSARERGAGAWWPHPGPPPGLDQAGMPRGLRA